MGSPPLVGRLDSDASSNKCILPSAFAAAKPLAVSASEVGSRHSTLPACASTPPSAPKHYEYRGSWGGYSRRLPSLWERRWLTSRLFVLTEAYLSLRRCTSAYQADGGAYQAYGGAYQAYGGAYPAMECLPAGL